METTLRQRSVPVLFIGLLLILFAASALVGGYLDWIWWHPTQGILVTLAAIGFLLLAGVGMLFRRPVATRVALAVGVVGAGLLTGQLLGPERPALTGSEGRVVIRLDAPIQAEARGDAWCQMEADWQQLQVSGDSNARLGLPGVEPMARPFVSASVYHGDRWSRGTEPPDNGMGLVILVSGAVEDASGGPAELRLESSADSQLQAQVGDGEGNLGFADLTVVSGNVESVLGTAGEVAGRVEWTCDEPRSAR